MGESTINLAIFNSYVCLPEGTREKQLGSRHFYSFSGDVPRSVPETMTGFIGERLRGKDRDGLYLNAHAWNLLLVRWFPR